MTTAEVLALVLAATRVISAGADIVSRMNDEGRADLTPEEIETMKEAQAVAEATWAEQLARLRAAETDD